MAKGGKKFFIDSDRKNLSTEVKTMCYIGHKIHESIDSGENMANTHINKHWPYEFQSGQSPAGIKVFV